MHDELLSHGIVRASQSDYHTVSNQSNKDSYYEELFDAACFEHDVSSHNAGETLCHAVGVNIECCVASGEIVCDDDSGVEVGMCACEAK